MLTASVYPPIAGPGTLATLIYDNLFDYQTSAYSHSKAATVGYDKMDMSIVVSGPETRDWITHGLGRHIEVVGPGGIVWEGFVNQISISLGVTTLSVGPLTDIANKIKVAYTTKRWDTNPPIGGDPAETTFASSTESINRWGTFEEVISGGEGLEATMLALRASKLNERAWPKISPDVSTGTAGQGEIALSCLGYYHYLNRYLFDDQTGATGTINLSTRIADVLDADPDSLFSSSNASIETNTLQVPDYDEGRDAGTVLQEAIGLGFASGIRAMFRVESGRFVTYEALDIDKEPKYVYSMYDKRPSVSLLDGTPVNSWDIETGEWIEIASLTAKPFSEDLPRHSDPRYIFIENVTYTAPHDFSIQGGLGNTLEEKIDGLGLGMTRG